MKMQNSPSIRMPSPPSPRAMKSIVSRPKKCAGAVAATVAGAAAGTGAGAAGTGAGVAGVIGAGAVVIAAATGAAATIAGVTGERIARPGRDGAGEGGIPALFVFHPMHPLQTAKQKPRAKRGCCLQAVTRRSIIPATSIAPGHATGQRPPGTTTTVVAGRTTTAGSRTTTTPRL